jgi:hypothetical protein
MRACFFFQQEEGGKEKEREKRKKLTIERAFAVVDMK